MIKLTGWRKRLLKKVDNAVALSNALMNDGDNAENAAYHTGAIDALDLVAMYIIMDQYETEGKSPSVEELNELGELTTFLQKVANALPKLEGESPAPDTVIEALNPGKKISFPVDKI